MRGEYEYPPIVSTGAGRVTSNVEPVRARQYPAEKELWVAVSDNVVPESVDLLQIDMNMTDQVGMQEGSDRAEHVVTSIQAIGPSEWGMKLSLKGATWELGIFQSAESKAKAAEQGGI